MVQHEAVDEATWAKASAAEKAVQHEAADEAVQHKAEEALQHDAAVAE